MEATYRWLDGEDFETLTKEYEINGKKTIAIINQGESD